MKTPYTLERYIKCHGIKDKWTIRFMQSLNSEQLRKFKQSVHQEKCRKDVSTIRLAARAVAQRWYYKHGYHEQVPRIKFN